MSRVTDTPHGAREAEVRETILKILAGARSARFMTELYAALKRRRIEPDDADRALSELEASGRVMIRDHFCADPHLAGVDLRVVAPVDFGSGADAQIQAIRNIDETWNKWLGEYLANHRCG